MKTFGYGDNPRPAWLLAGGFVLIVSGIVVGLFPRWPVPVSWPRPLAPRVTLGYSDRNGGQAVAELRTVRSPALMALSQGQVIPDRLANSDYGVNPPSRIPLESPLGMKNLAGNYGDDGAVIDIKGGSISQHLLGHDMSFGMKKSSVFQSAKESGTRNVLVEYGKGLEGKQVEVAGWSWEPWVQSGLPWTLGLDIQFNDRGRVTRVLLDVPAADASLNQTLIRSLYRQGRVRPVGPCQGRVEIYYPGRR